MLRTILSCFHVLKEIFPVSGSTGTNRRRFVCFHSPLGQRALGCRVGAGEGRVSRFQVGDPYAYIRSSLSWPFVSSFGYLAYLFYG